LEAEELRLDILRSLYSERHGEKYLSYQRLRDRLSNVEDSQLISELTTLGHLQLVEIQNGLAPFLEGSNPLGWIAITDRGEAYLESFEKRRVLLLNRVL